MGVFLIVLAFATEFRGVWVPRWSLNDRNEILTQLDGAFNHIFLQVYALGYAYYPSQYAPSKIHNDAWLKAFLKEAHQRNIRVSAWVNLFYSWGFAPRTAEPIHPINMHPNWYVADARGRSMLDYSIDELRQLSSEGYYLAPSNAQVRSYLCAVVNEIVTNYDFDGVHLDYVRYPRRSFIYDVYVRSAFMKHYYIDPLELTTNRSMPERYGLWGVDSLTEAWHGFVADDLTAFIRELRSVVTPRGAVLSVAVKPQYEEAQNHYFQDWPTWLRNNYVDFVCLMSYGTSISSTLQQALRAVDEPERVMVGIGLYLLTPQQVQQQVGLVRSQPFAGVVFFSYDQLKKNRAYLNTLK
ncbi:hypothetical protein AMJ87_05550 [candidate division WOR_3 bacterium SM23_60]|uniref:Glycosyl hydrolase-like 10 domain-containing protein n=1 Tax=candidate division WOR_3 bacterium SM23_60 TaxID=1703780 RepID=A0A0S8GID3_UNCW3|nr:MAG: hypothetical protein AMJ87_05550 [candidate division WOR_3 bacterium SM23_60]